MAEDEDVRHGAGQNGTEQDGAGSHGPDERAADRPTPSGGRGITRGAADDAAHDAMSPKKAPSRVRAGWDFTLMLLTVVLLAGLGAQSLVGTMYVWWAQRATPGWLEGAGYARYVALMNAIAAPLVVGLVVVIGLCVPKRIFERNTLLAVSGGLVALGVAWAAATGSVQNGMAAYLATAAALQVVVVVLTFQRTGAVAYLTEGRRRLGSALLHLGFIVFCLVVVALQTSAYMLPVFFLSAVLLAGGSALSFYARG
jgi:hypothetical protein